MNYKIKKAVAMIIVSVVFTVGFGQFIEKTSFSVQAAEQSGPIGYVSYVVKSGDSLWSIAKDRMPECKKDVKAFISELKDVNKLQSDYIYDGQLIAIPCYTMMQ